MTRVNLRFLCLFLLAFGVALFFISPIQGRAHLWFRLFLPGLGLAGLALLALSNRREQA